MARNPLLAEPGGNRLVADAGAPGVTSADAWQYNAQAYQDYVQRQREEGIRLGLIDPETGWPTRKGLIEGMRSYGDALLGGTSAPGRIRAYHGSPHHFDRFDMSKIGTGEGAQAYGHGLYFAEKEAVAKGYRDTLSAGKPVYDPVKDVMIPPDHPYYPDYVKQHGSPGKMYEVGIKADPAHMLDWDKPLSEQSPAVQAALRKAGVAAGGGWTSAAEESGVFYRQGARGQEASVRAIDRYGNGNVEWLATYDTLDGRGSQRFPTRESAQAWIDSEAPIEAGRGAEVYQQLRRQYSDADASRILREAGIPGIRYADAGSRSAEGGTSNYVVFDDKLVDILRKYGIAGLTAAGIANPWGGAPTPSDQQK